MWRSLLLAISVFLVGVQPSLADKVVVKVGKGHPHHRYYRHGRGHVFVYRNYWHHSNWGHVYLTPEFVTYLGPVEYSGPGYHVVTVYFADGTTLEKVYVYNRRQVELPPAYTGRRMVRVVVTN